MRTGRRTIQAGIAVLTAVAAVIGGSAGLSADEIATGPAVTGAPRHQSVARPSALVDRAMAEVELAVTEAGQPPCGTVRVVVEPTPDGRSWAWPDRCRILLDAGLVDSGDDGFRYVVRHEVAHLHQGTDHYDGGFRALDARLAARIGYDLVYTAGAEYGTLVKRSHPPDPSRVS